MKGSNVFDPADWLDRFKAAGGYWLVHDGKVQTGWQLFGNPRDEEAREVWREIEVDEERRAAVRALLIG